MKREGIFSILNSQFSIRRWQHRRRSGFTLIEMLVVIVIIVILMGVVFKLSKGAMDKATYAKETKRLAILRTLIEEFHAEYNTYPPIPEYEIGGKKVQPVNFYGAYPKTGDPQDLNLYPSLYNPAGKYFVFGLMSVFVPRDHYCQRAFDVGGTRDKKKGHYKEWLDANNDELGIDGKIKTSKKDEAFVKRVKPILEQIYLCYERYVEVDPENGRSKGFTTSISDSWGHQYVYISRPPYTTYLIFSPGPDGKYDRDNPGDRASSDNKDNVYGNLGDK